jgi:RNA polymerase sigma factor (sigma-70 family)
VSYNHELIDDMRTVCTPSTKTDNERLYQLLRQGDTSAREQLIVNNMPLVVAIVDTFTKAYPDCENERDDLTSEGFVAITKAVSALQDPAWRFREDNVTGYLGRSIEHHLIDIARRRQRQVKCQSSPVDYSKRSLAGVDSIERVEIEELIQHCCSTGFERSVVDLRRQGHTLQEIADIYGTNRMAISRCLKTVKTRFDARLNDLG